jgi:hypothetical protein
VPRYRFTGAFETVLHGLIHGANAVLHRPEAEHEQPPGSTVVAQPGDEIETDEPYPHAQLVNTDTGEPDQLESEGVPEPVSEVEQAGQAAAAALKVLQDAAAGAQSTAAIPPADTTSSTEPDPAELDTETPPAGTETTTVGQE